MSRRPTSSDRGTTIRAVAEHGAAWLESEVNVQPEGESGRTGEVTSVESGLTNWRRDQLQRAVHRILPPRHCSNSAISRYRQGRSATCTRRSNHSSGPVPSPLLMGSPPSLFIPQQDYAFALGSR